MAGLNDPYAVLGTTTPGTGRQGANLQGIPTDFPQDRPLVDPFAKEIETEPVEKKGRFQGFISGEGDVARGAADLVTGGDRPGQDLAE